MRSIWFPYNDPVLVGIDNAGVPQFLQIDPIDFSTHKQLTLSGVTSNSMWIRNRYTYDQYMVWAISSDLDNTLYLANVDVNNTMVGWSRHYNLEFKNPVFKYNTIFEDYILVGKDEGTNRNCFMRFDPTFGTVNYMKCTEASSTITYDIKTTSFHIDAATNMYIGGQLSIENFFVYRTGLELGDNSCVFSGGSVVDSNTYTQDLYSMTLSTTSIDLDVQTTGRWINRTDREVALDSTLSTTIK